MKAEKRIKQFKKFRKLQVSLYRLERLVDTKGMITDDLYKTPVAKQEPMLWEERHPTTHAAPLLMHH